MPTRQGWTVAFGAVAALVMGRVFAIVELFVIGAGLGLAVVVAVAVVTLRRPNLGITRWAHPSVLTVGETGRVDLVIENLSGGSSPRVDLTEPVGASNTAHMSVASLRSGEQVTAGYRVPATRRGLMLVGPAEITRRDVLGLASDSLLATAATEITVAPQIHELSMPALGHGVLGRHLLALAQRLGPGEFHSLRDYVVGDEPRSIHWRASARSTELKVRQNEAQGVRRCIVILDRCEDDYPPQLTEADEDVFERAIVAAGSIVASADRVGLTTRFVTGGGIDLRGPDVSPQTLRVIAPITLGPDLGDIERDPGEGLGLVVVVTPSIDTEAWRRTDRISDPTLTRVGVFTRTPAPGRLSIDATTIDGFRRHWQQLAGTHGLGTWHDESRPDDSDTRDPTEDDSERQWGPP